MPFREAEEGLRAERVKEVLDARVESHTDVLGKIATLGRALQRPVRKRDPDGPCRVSLPLASYNQRLVKGAGP